MERRKDRARRRIAEVMPVLALYLRKKHPKEIGRELGKSTWWVYKRLAAVKKALKPDGKTRQS